MSAFSAKKFADVHQAAAAVEVEMRQFARRGDAIQRAQPSEGGATAEVTAEYMSAFIQRVSVASDQEIDRVIRELHALRCRLLSDGEQVSRVISSYANLSQASMNAMKAIRNSLEQWGDAPADKNSVSGG